MKSNKNNTLTGLTRVKTTIPLAFRIVFLKCRYIAIAAVFTTFWIIFNVFDQLLFFHLS